MATHWLDHKHFGMNWFARFVLCMRVRVWCVRCLKDACQVGFSRVSVQEQFVFGSSSYFGHSHSSPATCISILWQKCDASTYSIHLNSQTKGDEMYHPVKRSTWDLPLHHSTLTLGDHFGDWMGLVKVWARCLEDSTRPPMRGWRIPWNGEEEADEGTA